MMRSSPHNRSVLLQHAPHSLVRDDLVATAQNQLSARARRRDIAILLCATQNEKIHRDQQIDLKQRMSVKQTGFVNQST